MASSGMSSPDRYSPPLTVSSTASSLQGSPILGQRQPQQLLQLQDALPDQLLSNSLHRKLDRSVSEPVGVPDRNSNLQQQQQQQQRNTNINSSRYKTELCRPFEESGYCKYGDKCQFAHGSHELRSLARHPKYKTELCRTFHTTGFCPYGPRCHFIHNEDERRLNQINQLKHQAQSSSQPSPVPRPKALNFPLSMSLNQGRDSLGSTADSPPSSVTDSPTMSPTFLGDDFLGSSGGLQSFHNQPPPQSAPPSMSRAFSFQEVSSTGLLAPLNVQTGSPDALAALTASLQAATLREREQVVAALRENQRNNNSLHPQDSSDMTWMPPSPPDSLNGDSIASTSTCGSPLDVSRGLRLPIFSQLSCDM